MFFGSPHLLQVSESGAGHSYRSGGYSSLARRRELSPDVSGPDATHLQLVTQPKARPGFPPKSRHVDSFAPAQSASRPSRLIRCPQQLNSGSKTKASKTAPTSLIPM